MPRKKFSKFEHVIEELKSDPKEVIFLKASCFDKKVRDINRNSLQIKIGESIMNNNCMYENVEEECRRIQEKYPLLYGEGVRCGFDPPRGWLKLVDEISAKIEEINQDLVKKGFEPFRCNQIKEKFAALRIYVGSSNAPKNIGRKVFDLLHEYEQKSRSICEISGNEGAFLCNCNGWLHTLTQESLDMIGGERVEQGKTPGHLRKIYHDLQDGKTDKSDLEK